MTKEFKVISYNIWFDSLLISERTLSLVNLIENLNPDAICLQEVRPNVYAYLISVLENYKYHFPKQLSKSYDCAIFSKYPIKKCLCYPYPNSTMGRSLLITKIDVPYKENNITKRVEIVLTTTHFESLFKKVQLNKVKIEQFNLASGILDNLYKIYKNVILTADTNVLQHEEGKFDEFFDKASMWSDSWSMKGSELSRYTYDSYKNVYLNNRFPNNKYRSRIDRILFKADNLVLEEFVMLGKRQGPDQIEISDHFGIMSKFLIKR
jgi:exonuclease III